MDFHSYVTLYFLNSMFNTVDTLTIFNTDYLHKSNNLQFLITYLNIFKLKCLYNVSCFV